MSAYQRHINRSACQNLGSCTTAGTGSSEQKNRWERADGSKNHTAFISVIELPRIPAECLKNAWHDIFSIMEDKNKSDLSAAQIQEKYGFDPKYQDSTINRYKKISMQEKEIKVPDSTQEN